jgi:hypothetical protein
VVNGEDTKFQVAEKHLHLGQDVMKLATLKFVKVLNRLACPLKALSQKNHPTGKHPVRNAQHVETFFSGSEYCNRCCYQGVQGEGGLFTH